MGKTLYTVSGHGRTCAGRHEWFGPVFFGGARGFRTYVETPSKRHADAQYRRLKIAERQMDIRQTGREARVLKYGVHP